jgi:hypothetical protein
MEAVTISRGRGPDNPRTVLNMVVHSSSRRVDSPQRSVAGWRLYAPSGMTDRLRWDPALTARKRGREFLRDPIRIGLAVGAAAMAVGGLLPWAEGLIGFLPMRFGGLDGAADGLIMFTLAIVTALIASNEGFLEADDGARRWAPMLIGLACVFLWLLGGQAAQMEISRWQDDDGSGSLQPGYWLAGVGAVTVAIVGTVASSRRREGDAGSVLPSLRRPRRSDVAQLAVAAGAIAGAIAGGALALALFSGVTVVAPMVFFAAIGSAVGAYVARGLGRRLFS